MAGLPWPEAGQEEGDLYNVVTLGELFLPGICKVKVSRAVEIEKAKAGNSHGAQLKFKGVKPASVDIEWRVWDAPGVSGDGSLTQWDEMQDILGKLDPQPGRKDLLPWVIFNPLTLARGISSVAIESIDGPAYADGIMTVNIKCTEWLPPPPSSKGTGTAKAEKDGSQWGQAPSKDGTINVGSTVVNPDGTTSVVIVDVPKPPTDANKNAPSKTETDP